MRAELCAVLIGHTSNKLLFFFHLGTFTMLWGKYLSGGGRGCEHRPVDDRCSKRGEGVYSWPQGFLNHGCGSGSGSARCISAAFWWHLSNKDRPHMCFQLTTLCCLTLVSLGSQLLFWGFSSRWVHPVVMELQMIKLSEHLGYFSFMLAKENKLRLKVLS